MDKFYNLKIKINKEENLLRLDVALAKLSNLSRSQIKILILNDNIQKNNKIYKDASYKVKSGEIYILNFKAPEKINFEAENIPINIIFEDSDILIINKVSGMVTHPAPGNRSGTLVNALLYYSKNKLSNVNENNRPGIVHRLDKETSGLMVIAKNNEAHINLAEQFKKHTISRKYKAIVWGVPENQTIEGYIERNKINRKKMSLNKNNNGRFSKTQIKLLKNFNIASLIECKLYTGRTHQVRLHMESIKKPIIGDKIYGKISANKLNVKKELFNKYLFLKNFSRHALHAYNLGFNHPKSNKYLEFNDELPQDMQNLLNFIVKY